MPSTAGRALVSLIPGATFLRGRARGSVAATPAAVPAWDLLRIDTCWSAAVGFGLIDLIRSAEFQTRSLQLALRAASPYRVARCLAPWKRSSSRSGARVRARVDRLLASASALATDLRERARRRPRGHGRRRGLPGSRAAGGTRAGLCDEAAVILRERCVGATWETDNAEMYALASLFMLGGDRGALAAAAAPARARGGARNLLAVRYLRVACFSHVAWLAADDPDGARAEIAPRRSPQPQRLRLQPALAAGAQPGHRALHGRRAGRGAPLREGWRGAARALDRFPQAGLILSLFSRARRRVALGAAAAGPAAAAHPRSGRPLCARAPEPACGVGRWVRPSSSSPAARRHEAGASARWRRSRRRAARLDAVHMALFAAAARRCRGELLGGGGRPRAGGGGGRVDGSRSRSAAWTAWRAVLAPGAWRSV